MPEHEPLDYRLRCHTKRTDLPADVLRDIGEAYAEIKRLSEEQDDTHALIETTGAILAATADALHGGALSNGNLHSWHDLPELVEKLRKERDDARREVCNMNETGLRMNESDKKREAKRRGWDCFNTPEAKIDRTLNGVIVDGGKAIPPKYEGLGDE